MNSVHQIVLATHGCLHKIQGINVWLQNHHWLWTPLTKFITSDLCALLKLAFCKWMSLYCAIPKRHKITFTDFFIKCSLLVEWPAQLSWVLSHLQESPKNTYLPSLFDPLTLALSILILFYKIKTIAVFILKPIKHSNTMVIEPAFGTFGCVGRCQILLENEISISIKLVSRRKHEVLYFLVDGCIDGGLHKTQWTNTSRWHGSPNHHWLWKLHTGLQATWILFLSTEMYFHLKRGLWTTEQQSSSFSP